MPILSSTPARITEPAVGAWTWASGSQVWNGNSGTLMAKASANARKNQNCVRGSSVSWYSCSRLKLYWPVAWAWITASPMIATSISTLPAIV